jgi:arabinose-5-phosphate isomerase
MACNQNNAVVLQGETLKNAIIEMGKKGLGMVTVVDSNSLIQGVITDGDLRRQLEKGVDVYNLVVDEVMSQKPTILTEEMMAVEALQVLKQKNISSAPIMDNNKQSVGTIRLQDILNAGIVL